MGAQGKDDGSAPLTPNVEGDYASGNAPQQPRNRKWVHIGVWIFVLINLIVLYILHFVDNNAGKSNAVSGDFKSKDLSSTSSDAKKGMAVSYGADGKLRVGAGTTAYLDAAELPESKISYMQFAPMGTSSKLYDTNLIAYVQGVAPSQQTVVTTISADASTKTVKLGSADDKNTLKATTPKGLTTLSDKFAVLLTTVASADGLIVTPYTTPVALDGKSASVLADKKVMAANASATNFVTAVSDKAFVHVFYEPNQATVKYFERVQVGELSTDGTITFSKSVQFGEGNTNSSYTTIGQPQKVLKNGARFAVPWFVDTSAAMAMGTANATATKNPGLCISTFSYDSGAVTADKDLCNDKYQPAYYVDSTKLADNVLALAFIDTANKNSLTIVTVEYSDITFQPKFRSAVTIDEATGVFDFGASTSGFYPKPSIQVLGDNRVAIGFLNPSNTGKPSVKVFKYSSDLALSEASPVLPIANADFTLATADAKAFGAVVINTLPVTSGFLVAFGSTWAGKQFQRISFVESFGDPVGVLTKAGSSLSVAMAGTAEVDVSLEAGRAYYAATSGKLYTPSSTSTDKFVLVNEDKIVVSRSSLVGVAVSGSKLFVSAQANSV